MLGHQSCSLATVACVRVAVSMIGFWKAVVTENKFLATTMLVSMRLYGLYQRLDVVRMITVITNKVIMWKKVPATKLFGSFVKYASSRGGTVLREERQDNKLFMRNMFESM